MKILFTLPVLLLLFSANTFSIEGTQLIYRQQEPGVEPYDARVLVTAEYLRMDDGVDDDNYLLFNRKQHLISSVTHDDGTIFEIRSRKIIQRPPLKLRRRSIEIKLDDAPNIEGKKARHHQLYVNDKVCYNVVAVKGLLADTQQTLIAFRSILAGEHAKLLPRLPADQRDSCDMARNIFHPAWQLEFGLPIQEWDDQGRGQVLLDYKEGVKLDDKLFSLPQGYRHYSTEALQ